jgi:hypothetical protein
MIFQVGSVALGESNEDYIERLKDMEDTVDGLND